MRNGYLTGSDGVDRFGWSIGRSSVSMFALCRLTRLSSSSPVQLDYIWSDINYARPLMKSLLHKKTSYESLNKTTKIPVETKVGDLQFTLPINCVMSNLVDIRQGSSEDLLIANPNHQSEDSEEEKRITTSDEGGTLRETARERIIFTN